MITINSTKSTKLTVVNLLQDWQRLLPVWNEFVEKHSKGSIFHTPEMIRVFAAAKGYSPLPLAAVTAGGEIAALFVAVRVQTLPSPLGAVSSRSLSFAEPLCTDDTIGIEALCEVISEHDRIMSRDTLFAEVRPLVSSSSEKVALEACGYEHLDYLNYLVDVTQSTQSLWSRVRANTRTCIRKCERNGFRIQERDFNDPVASLYEFLRSTFHRAKVPLPDRSLFDAAAEILGPKGWIKFVGAFDSERQIGMDALLLFKRRAIGWYGGGARLKGASSYEYMQWHEIAWAAQNGYSIYDFGGAGRPDESYGVREFKSRFGGQLVCYGRYRKVFAPRILAIAECAFELGRAFISPK